jgi:hypothetical protein
METAHQVDARNLYSKPEDKIDKLTFERGGMISTKRSMYNGSDLVTGSRDGRSFALSAISVIKSTLIYSGYMTLFNGLYFTVPVGGFLQDKIYLVPPGTKKSHPFQFIDRFRFVHPLLSGTEILSKGCRAFCVSG